MRQWSLDLYLRVVSSLSVLIWELVVSSQEEDLLWVEDLEGKEIGDYFNLVRTTVHIITCSEDYIFYLKEVNVKEIPKKMYFEGVKSTPSVHRERAK